MSEAETPYLETEIMLAVMQGDEARVEKMLCSMFPSERRLFHSQVHALLDTVHRVRVELGETS